jgi:hypothetical protein
MQKYTLTFLSLILPICIYYLDINLLNGMWGDELIAGGQYSHVGFPHAYVLCILFVGWLILTLVVLVKWLEWLNKQK